MSAPWVSLQLRMLIQLLLGDSARLDYIEKVLLRAHSLHRSLHDA